MACSWNNETDTTTAAGGITRNARECLIDKLLGALMSIGRNNQPKFRSTLQNALCHCAVVVPYMNPLHVLGAANEASAEPTVSVDIPYPKKRVYTQLETARAAHRSRRFKNLLLKRPIALVAPVDGELEKFLMDDVIAWLKSDQEGTEESLVEKLIQRCEKEFNFAGIALDNLEEIGICRLDEEADALHFFPQVASSSDLVNKSQQSGTMTLAEAVTVRTLLKLNEISSARFPLTAAVFGELVGPTCKVLFTVPPARLFGMNRRRIKHREVVDDNTETPTAAEPVKPADQKEAASSQKPKLEFAIGVQPGENAVHKRISLTPKGLVGIETPITDRGKAASAGATGEPTVSKDDDCRMRAVGQTKGLAEFFTKRLTVAVRSNNAVLVPANEEEQQHIIPRVREWLHSKRMGPATRVEGDHDHDGGGGAVASSNPPQQTVAKLQHELANMCVGKARRLAPSSITDLLQNAGYISIGDDDKVTYHHLPTDRGSINTPSWQQKTVKAAVKRCNLSNLMRQAYPRISYSSYSECSLQ